MTISIKRISSGYWHIRGEGPCNWAQPPTWPCSESVLREHAFCQASEEFIREIFAACTCDGVTEFKGADALIKELSK